MSLYDEFMMTAEQLGVTASLGSSLAQVAGETWRQAAEAFDAACKPRTPRPEWFGTGPGQWDSWWIEYRLNGRIYQDSIVRRHAADMLPHIISCVPVAREGFPAPVGWHVVGG